MMRGDVFNIPKQVIGPWKIFRSSRIGIVGDIRDLGLMIVDLVLVGKTQYLAIVRRKCNGGRNDDQRPG